MAKDKLNISPLWDDQGELKGPFVFCDEITGEINAKEALIEGKRVFDTLMGNLPGIAYRCFNNRQWTMEFLSSGCLELTGYSSADLIGDSRISFVQLIHPDDRDRIWNEVQMAIADDRQYQLEYRIRALPGEEKWVWEKGCAIKSGRGEIVALEGFITDITIRKQTELAIVHEITDAKRAEQEIVRLNRLYTVLSNVNQVIVRVRNRKDLLDEVCRIIVADGLFPLAWVGLVDRERSRIDVVSDYGQKKGFIEKLKITWGETNASFWRGPSGVAIRQGESQIINDVQADEIIEVWQKLSKEYDVKSLAAFPIKTAGDSIGNLTIYAMEKNYFQEAEINLLNELVSDISYALEFMIQEEVRRKTEAALRQSEERYQSFINSTSDMVFLKDEQFRIILTNRSMQDFYHKTQEELIGKTDFDFFPEEAAQICRQTDIAALASGTVISEEVMGSQIYETVKFPVEFGLGIRGVGGYVRNITEKKQTEEKLRKSYENLNKVMFQTIQSLATTIEMRDPYTHGHQERVTRLTVAVATQMGLSEEDIRIIGLAALVHDIGKIQIPAEILNKPGKLSAIEFSLIKNHPRAGFEIISKIDFPGPVAQIVLQHHERLDGSGYPGGIAGGDILPGARIIAVADVMEAMASHRPYRPALGLKKAVEEIIENRNTFYDPLVVDSCINLIEEQGFSFD